MSDVEVAVVFAHAEADEVTLVKFQFRMEVEWFYVVDL